MSVAVKVNGRLELDDLQKIVARRHLQPGGRVQQYIDSEVIRRCNRRVPVDSHTLRKSAEIHSRIGSGWVRYVTPYAKKQYDTNTGRNKTGCCYYRQDKSAQITDTFTVLLRLHICCIFFLYMYVTRL